MQTIERMREGMQASERVLLLLVRQPDDSSLTSSLISSKYSQATSKRLCMVDLEFDHGFAFDDQGRTDILHSPFFDVQFSEDDVTIEDYIDRILYQLTLTIEEHILAGHWNIVSRPTNPPSPTPSTTNSALKATCLLVASLKTRNEGLLPWIGDLEDDGRTGTFAIGNETFPASLLDLPGVVESYKTYDDTVLIKTADIGQIIMVREEGEPSPEGIEYRHGLTPPMRDARRRRFRREPDLNPELVQRVEKDLLNIMSVPFIIILHLLNSWAQDHKQMMQMLSAGNQLRSAGITQSAVRRARRGAGSLAHEHGVRSRQARVGPQSARFALAEARAGRAGMCGSAGREAGREVQGIDDSRFHRHNVFFFRLRYHLRSHSEFLGMLWIQ
ncbi:hypothetical protein M5K25_014014 [Dendrobium thyrsiflorum]|uniref:TAFII55 protein conserved region domain-containing protein n=1 Tax=Dendrobium thyrsiflorum TaxID=117978 RepID=A0ABD0UV50_DENTH